MFPPLSAPRPARPGLPWQCHQGRHRAWSLALHIANGEETDDTATDTGPLHGVHHLVDILVGGAGFFGEARLRDGAHVDPTLGHVVQECLGTELFAGLGPTHGAPTTMRRAEERLRSRGHP